MGRVPAPTGMRHQVSGVAPYMHLRLVLLGDSIAFGVGADRPSDTLAHRLAGALRTAPPSPRTVMTEVFAVPGATSAGLAAQAAEAIAWAADIAVMCIGANDLTRLRRPQRAAGELREAVRALTGKGVRVVVAPAPDMSVVPDVPPAMRALVRTASRQLRSAQMTAVLAEGGWVADPDAAMAERFARDPALFSADRFHPSSAGYALIAASLGPPVLAALADLTCGASAPGKPAVYG
ncbi:MAG: family lipase [Frankiales bacterium]|nr:family lipase [Frankiales bacterium]